MRLKDVAELQRGYVALIADQKFTKKNLVALVVPFRDKYGLTDKQALCIARKEYPLFQVCELLSKPTTNGDYIRAVADDTFAKWLGGHLDCEVCPVRTNCSNGIKCTAALVDWLKQPRRMDDV